MSPRTKANTPVLVPRTLTTETLLEYRRRLDHRLDNIERKLRLIQEAVDPRVDYEDDPA